MASRDRPRKSLLMKGFAVSPKEPSHVLGLCPRKFSRRHAVHWFECQSKQPAATSQFGAIALYRPKTPLETVGPKGVFKQDRSAGTREAFETMEESLTGSPLYHLRTFLTVGGCPDRGRDRPRKSLLMKGFAVLGGRRDRRFVWLSSRPEAIHLRGQDPGKRQADRRRYIPPLPVRASHTAPIHRR